MGPTKWTWPDPNRTPMKNYELEELKALEFEGARFQEEGDSRGRHGGAPDDNVTISPRANLDTDMGINPRMEGEVWGGHHGSLSLCVSLSFSPSM